MLDTIISIAMLLTFAAIMAVGDLYVAALPVFN